MARCWIDSSRSTLTKSIHFTASLNRNTTDALVQNSRIDIVLATPPSSIAAAPSQLNSAGQCRLLLHAGRLNLSSRKQMRQGALSRSTVGINVRKQMSRTRKKEESKMLDSTTGEAADMQENLRRSRGVENGKYNSVATPSSRRWLLQNDAGSSSVTVQWSFHQVSNYHVAWGSKRPSDPPMQNDFECVQRGTEHINGTPPLKPTLNSSTDFARDQSIVRRQQNLTSHDDESPARENRWIQSITCRLQRT
jgi:hypothetical protein